jgi:hypothetical protein
MKLLPSYLVHEESIAWSPIEIPGTHGKTWIKIFARDPETKATAALVKYEQGCKIDAAVSRVYCDTLFFSGKMTGDGKSFTKNSYVYRPAGTKIGAMVAEEETVKLIISGGIDEKCSPTPVFIQDCVASIEGGSHMGSDWSKLTLRVDEEAECVVVYQICHKAGIFNPGETWVHPHIEEAYFVECHGSSLDYLGEIDGHIAYTSPCYLYRPPGSRHGNAQYCPSTILCKYYSTELAPDEIFKLTRKTKGIPMGHLVQ